MSSVKCIYLVGTQVRDGRETCRFLSRERQIGRYNLGNYKSHEDQVVCPIGGKKCKLRKVPKTES